MRLRVALSLLSAWVSVSAAELIVVTPERMAAEAAELAELHRRYQAMDVEVMVVADSVAANPEKLKSVIVDAYRRDCFGSLLLVGRSYGLSHSATWMGRLVSADDSGPDVAVGRIPADEPEQLAAYVAKARAYLARGRSGNVGSESVMVSSDYGDGFRHLRNAEALCGVMPDAIIRKVYLDMEPVPLVEAQCLSPQSRRAIERGLDEGVHTWIHFGHGSSTALSARGLWDVTAARSSRCRRPPWVMLMSCDTGLPSASDMNLCEAMVLNPLGGAMGVIGATDLTRPSINEDLMKIYMAARAKADRDATAGEVWLAAQRAAQACGYPAVGSYMQRYELFGDPALPLFLVPESAAIIVPADAVSPGEPFALDVSAPGATEVNVAVYAPPRRVDVDTIALNINNIKIWERRVALDGAGRVEVVLPPCAPGVGRIEASCGAAVRGSASLTIDDVVAAPFDTVAPRVSFAASAEALCVHVADRGSGVDGCRVMVDGRELARGEFVVEGHDDGSLTLTITTSTYLWGIHSVVVTATDCCGNASEAEFALDVAPRASLDAVADGSGGVTFRWSHNLGPWTEATLSLTDIGGRVLTTWRLSAACRYEWPAHEVNSSAVVATLRLSSGGVRVVAEPLKLSR